MEDGSILTTVMRNMAKHHSLLGDSNLNHTTAPLTHIRAKARSANARTNMGCTCADEV